MFRRKTQIISHSSGLMWKQPPSLVLSPVRYQELDGVTHPTCPEHPGHLWVKNLVLQPLKSRHHSHHQYPVLFSWPCSLWHWNPMSQHSRIKRVWTWALKSTLRSSLGVRAKSAPGERLYPAFIPCLPCDSSSCWLSSLWVSWMRLPQLRCLETWDALGFTF